MAINTTINGSSGTCREAADWLGDLARQAEATGGWYYRGLGAAESGWEGPAHDAFVASVDGVGRTLDDLDFTAREYERALREFADALDKVIDRMNCALEKARDGDLEVEGPFIKRPRGPGPPPETAIGMVRPDTPPEQVRIIQQASEDYNEEVRAHNAKVDVYNECLEIAQDAHNREDEAHANLREAMAGPEDWDIDGWNIGMRSLGEILGAVATAEAGRTAALEKAKYFANEGEWLREWAEGRVRGLGEADTHRLDRAIKHAGAAEHHYQQRVSEFERFLNLPRPDDAGTTKVASAGVRSLPYAASMTVVGNEAYNAFKGEQTWTQAAARSSGMIASSWAGAKALGALGSVVGPKGVAIGTVGGGIAAGIAGERVVDYFTPDPNDELYEPMQHYEEVELGKEGRR